MVVNMKENKKSFRIAVHIYIYNIVARGRLVNKLLRLMVWKSVFIRPAQDNINCDALAHQNKR
jgi:hypothetical protein